MTQQLAKVENNYMTAWSQEDLNLIKKTVAKNADDAEFKLFLYTAWKYELDPLVKQIWCVKYGNNPAAIYAGRDGFLAIAHRSGQLDGMETTAIRNEKGDLIGAECKVWRKDMKHPFVVEVALSEYKSNNNSNWNTRPETMLKKVAESQCLRRAFSISGMYEPSEMDEVYEQPAPKAEPAKIVSIVPNTDTVPEPEVYETALASDQQRQAIRKLAIRRELSDAELQAQITEIYGTTTLEKLSKNEAAHLIKVLQGGK